MYIFFLSVILICEVGVGIAALVEQSSIEGYIQDELSAKSPLAQNSANANLTIVIQETFDCCGLVQGCSDWQGNVTYGCGCSKGDEDCVKVTTTTCSSGDK